MANIHISRAESLGHDTELMLDLEKLGYRITQAQGPDWAEDGTPVVYENADGPVENPPMVMWVEQDHPSKDELICGTYIRADAPEVWQTLINEHDERLRRASRTVEEHIAEMNKGVREHLESSG